jgi:hypothetical protein
MAITLSGVWNLYPYAAHEPCFASNTSTLKFRVLGRWRALALLIARGYPPRMPPGYAPSLLEALRDHTLPEAAAGPEPTVSESNQDIRQCDPSASVSRMLDSVSMSQDLLSLARTLRRPGVQRLVQNPPSTVFGSR